MIKIYNLIIHIFRRNISWLVHHSVQFLKLQHGANPTGRDSALWWMDVLPDCLLMKMTFRNF